MAIQFQILGPLEVQAADAPVAIGGPRQRALLAMLLLSANRVVSRDRLIDELLADAPADKAERMLRVQVSRLRRVLDAVDGSCPRLVARSPGYVLRVEPGELDLERFEALLAEGHAALEEQDYERAARVLREAQSAWRGRPLADLEFERFARIDIERLEELRLAALEDRIEAELALGRHSMLIAELEALVAEHPLRERPRGQLMLALYRCGRQADALETYRAARSLLSDELALEPSPALRQLEQSILRQEPALELAVRESESVATDLAPLSGPPAVELSPSRRGGRAPPATRVRRVVLAAVALTVAAAAAVAVVLASRGPRALSATADSVGMIDAGAGKLRAVVPVGGPPGGIATGAGAVWETDTADDLLLEIDPETRTIERIPVGRGPTGVAVGDGEVWVVNQLDRTVSAINPRSLTAVRSFPVGNGAAAAAFGDGSLWVANTIDDTVSRIDPSSGTESTIPLAGQPAGIAVGPGGGIWVTDRSSGQLLLIDPRSDRVTQAQEIGGAPAGVAVGAGSVWVANTAERTVTRFDPGSGAVTNIRVGQSPVGVAYGAGAIWAADSLDGTVARIDPRSDSARLIRVGGSPTAITAIGKQLWTTVLPGHATHLGGTLTMAEGAIASSVGDSLDPAEFAGISQWQMLSMTNDGLVTYRRAGGLSGSTLVPDLATGLPIPTDGGRTYTFHLRRGIRYSTGAPVKPEDFRHELERVFKLGNGYPQSFYTGLVGAQACMTHPSRCSLASGIVSDDMGNTITFHLTAPDPDFLYKLAFPWADAVPADTPDRSLGRSMPPATGPYMTKSISPGQGSTQGGHPLAFGTWTLVRNPRFHEWNAEAQPPGYPDKIVLRQGEHPGQEVNNLEQGRIDVLLPVPASRLSDLAAHYTQRFHSEPLGATFSLIMNTRVAPFNNLLVRRALNYAVDRGRIVNLAGGPLAAQPACQILPPNIPGYRPYCPYTLNPSAGGSWTAANLAEAEHLVTTSHTRGMRVTAVVPPADATNPTTKVGRYIVALLNRLGYRASLRVAPNEAAYYQTLDDSPSHIQLGWFTWEQDFPAPSDFISLLLTCRAFLPHSQSNLNNAEFCDPAVDHAVSRAQTLEPSAPGSANETWAAIDRRITNQAPWLTMYNPRLAIATSSRVGNYQYHPFFGLLPDQLWVR